MRITNTLFGAKYLNPDRANANELCRQLPTGLELSGVAVELRIRRHSSQSIPWKRDKHSAELQLKAHKHTLIFLTVRKVESQEQALVDWSYREEITPTV